MVEMNIQDHDWKQRGTYLICETCRNRHALSIPTGKMLVGEKGSWELADEGGQKRDIVQMHPQSDVSQSASHSRLVT